MNIIPKIRIIPTKTDGLRTPRPSSCDVLNPFFTLLLLVAITKLNITKISISEQWNMHDIVFFLLVGYYWDTHTPERNKQVNLCEATRYSIMQTKPQEHYYIYVGETGQKKWNNTFLIVAHNDASIFLGLIVHQYVYKTKSDLFL